MSISREESLEAKIKAQPNVRDVFEPNPEYQPPRVPKKQTSTSPFNSVFVNRLCLYHLKETHVERKDRNYAQAAERKAETLRMVRNLVKDILDAGSEKFKVPLENIKACGGFCEDMYAKSTRDCDYNISIDIPIDLINFQHECHMGNEAPNRAKRNRFFKGYFAAEAYQNADILNKWKCERAKCNHREPSLDCNFAFDPKVIQKQFFNSVLSGMRMVFDIDIDPKQNQYCFMTGPAVSIALRVNDRAKNYTLGDCITIDIALAMPLRQDWKNCSCLDNVTVPSPTMVMSGNYWRLSFSERETEIISYCTDNAKYVLFVAKAIRDICLPDFPTYPIKEAFLHNLSGIERDFQENTENSFWHFSDNVAGIFNYIKGEAWERSFYNYHQTNDPVVEKSDAAYIEVDVLLEYLENENSNYMKTGRHQLIFTIIMCLFNCILFAQNCTITWSANQQNNSTMYSETKGAWVNLVLTVGIIECILAFIFTIVVINFLAQHSHNIPKTVNIFYGRGIKFRMAQGCIFTDVSCVMIPLAAVPGATSAFLLGSAIISGIYISYNVINTILFLVFACKNSCAHASAYKYECILSDQLCLRCYFGEENMYELEKPNEIVISNDVENQDEPESDNEPVTPNIGNNVNSNIGNGLETHGNIVTSTSL